MFISVCDLYTSLYEYGSNHNIAVYVLMEMYEKEPHCFRTHNSIWEDKIMTWNIRLPKTGSVTILSYICVLVISLYTPGVRFLSVLLEILYMYAHYYVYIYSYFRSSMCITNIDIYIGNHTSVVKVLFLNIATPEM